MNKLSISDIADIVMGQSPKGETCNRSGIGKPLLNGPTEFGTFYPTATQYTTGGKKISREGDILFCVRGSTTGRMNWADKEYVLGRGLASIRHKEGNRFNHFLKYLIEYNLDSILKMTGGSTFPNLTGDMLNSFKMVIPKAPQPERINKLFKDIDAKIELNNKINQELEAMAKTLYNYWFVQFDFPNEQGKPYKSSGGKMIYNEELKREIPEGWEVKPISEWIEKDKNGDWGKDQKEGNYDLKVSCVRGADINGLNGEGDLSAPTRYILEKNSNRVLECDDLIVEISGGSPVQSTGRLALITDETLERFENPLICSNFCKAVKLKKEKLLYNFAFLWNRLYDHGVMFGWEGKTSGIKNLLFESFITNRLEVYPQYDVVEKFYDFAHAINRKKQKNLQENQHLKKLRDWLLPMLMNGQVSVKVAKDLLDMAAEPSTEYGNKRE